ELRVTARAPRIHHLATREHIPFGHEPGEPLDQLVAELGLRLASRANRNAVELEHLRILVGSRLESPLVRRNQPRPPEHGAGLENLKLERRPFDRRDLHRDLAADDHVETVGAIAETKQDAVAGHPAALRALGEKLDVLAREPGEKRIAVDDVEYRKIIHARRLGLDSTITP